jgi:hypothetical protein
MQHSFSIGYPHCRDQLHRTPTAVQTDQRKRNLRGTSFRKMTLSKMLRYETAMERNLGRALDRLERRQRRRRGEPVPPPLRVRLTQ